jgi:signal transduction histidine kinase
VQSDGKILIKVKGAVNVSGPGQADGIRIEVLDNGSGIPEELLGRIFDPFFTTKPVGSGTGLGLSITHGIIRKHHGQIDVESKPGEGTTFRITLPIQQPASEQTPNP